MIPDFNTTFNLLKPDENVNKKNYTILKCCKSGTSFFDYEL